MKVTKKRHTYNRLVYTLEDNNDQVMYQGIGWNYFKRVCETTYGVNLPKSFGNGNCIEVEEKFPGIKVTIEE